MLGGYTGLVRWTCTAEGQNVGEVRYGHVVPPTTPPPPGRCFNFHSGRAGGPLPPGPPPSLPWTPSPPPPSALIHLSIRVLGIFFVWANFFLPHLRCTYSRVLWSLRCVLSSVYCRSHVPVSHKCVLQHPVKPCPCAKRNDVVNTILYFRFQDRWTGKKRQEAYNVAQKACSTLLLNSP